MTEQLKRRKKDRYKLLVEHHDGWHVIAQTANNVWVAYVHNLQLAELLVEILNDLPRRTVLHVKRKRMYDKIRRSKKDE